MASLWAREQSVGCALSIFPFCRRENGGNKLSSCLRLCEGSCGRWLGWLLSLAKVAVLLATAP